MTEYIDRFLGDMAIIGYEFAVKDVPNYIKNNPTRCITAGIFLGLGSLFGFQIYLLQKINSNLDNICTSLKSMPTDIKRETEVSDALDNVLKTDEIGNITEKAVKKAFESLEDK